MRNPKDSFKERLALYRQIKLEGSILRRVFIGERGIRAGWRALLFVGIFQGLVTGTAAVLGRFMSLKPSGAVPLALALIRESWEMLVVLAATWVMARIEKRSVFAFGYVGSGKLIRLVSGAIWGFVSYSSASSRNHCYAATSNTLWLGESASGGRRCCSR